MTAPRRKTPSVSGIRVAGETLTRGLSVDGSLLRARPDEDIVTFRFGTRRGVVLRHPDYVDHVLHDGADSYHKSIEYELLRSVLGLSTFTDEGESWRKHRMMLNPVMAKRHLTTLIDLMIDPIERFDDELATGGNRIEMDMTHAMTELTLDVVGAALFGRGMADLARKMAPTVTNGLRAAEFAARLTLVANPPWWLARGLAMGIHHAPLIPPPLNRLQAIMRTVDKMVWEVIHDRQENPVETEDLLGLLLTVKDEYGAPLPLKRVRNEALTFMLAGHETTANALAWTWYMLALNTEARDRMLAEVDSVLGDRRPTLDDIARMPWTTACFEEGMRFFPPAWVIPRTAIETDYIDGYRIPKGASVIIPIHALHHDERFWDQPEVFDPTRFLPENARKHHRSAYLPFGGGRRICIGSSFALMESTLILAMMSQRYVYDLVPGHPVEPEATLTLRPRHGLKMIARRRLAEPVAVAA